MASKRNKPCPCGSGIKYKKCCLVKQLDAARQQRDIRRYIDEFTKRNKQEEKEEEVVSNSIEGSKSKEESNSTS